MDRTNKLSTLVELSQIRSDNTHRGAVFGYEGSSAHDELEDRFGHMRRDLQNYSAGLMRSQLAQVLVALWFRSDDTTKNLEGKAEIQKQWRHQTI